MQHGMLTGACKGYIGDVPCMDVRTPRRLRPVVSHLRPAVTRPCTLPSTPESALSYSIEQPCHQ